MGEKYIGGILTNMQSGKIKVGPNLYNVDALHCNSFKRFIRIYCYYS